MLKSRYCSAPCRSSALICQSKAGDIGWNPIEGYQINESSRLRLESVAMEYDRNTGYLELGQIGFPLSNAMNNPLVFEWMNTLPWLKEAFVKGQIAGILFLQVPVVAVNQGVEASLIEEMILKLGVKVNVVSCL
jgi:hypothetical protein